MQRLVVRTGLLFIDNSVRCASVTLGHVLGKYIIGSIEAKKLMLAGEGLIHRDCVIYIYIGTDYTHT